MEVMTERAFQLLHNYNCRMSCILVRKLMNLRFSNLGTLSWFFVCSLRTAHPGWTVVFRERLPDLGRPSKPTLRMPTSQRHPPALLFLPRFFFFFFFFSLSSNRHKSQNGSKRSKRSEYKSNFSRPRLCFLKEKTLWFHFYWKLEPLSLLSIKFNDENKECAC